MAFLQLVDGLLLYSHFYDTMAPAAPCRASVRGPARAVFSKLAVLLKEHRVTISALGIGLTGLQANGKALGVEAHNTANMHTGHFVPQAASFNEARPAGTGVTLSIAARDLSAAENVGGAPSGTDPAASIVNSLVYKAGFELSARLIQAADERLGTLIDIRA
jgi:hypothetical protein